MNAIAVQLTEALANGGRHLGDVVGWSQHGASPRFKADQAAEAHGLVDDLKLPIINPAGAYRQALRSAVKGTSDERNWSVTLVEETSERIVHAILAAEEVADATTLSDKTREFRTSTKVAFNKGAQRLKHVDFGQLFEAEDPAHPVAVRARKGYLDLVECYRIAELRDAFQFAFRRWAGVRLVEHGGVWWIPAPYAEKVRAWAAFMGELHHSILVLPLFDTKEAVASLQEAAKQSLEGQLEEIVTDLQEFAGADTTRLSTLEDRLERWERLRNDAELYERLLGMRMAELGKGLDEARGALNAAITGWTPRTKGKGEK